MTRDPELEGLVDALRARGFEGARIAIVLGSGLGGFVERVERARSVGYAELDGMPRSGVPGHAGRLVVGEIAGERVIVQAGRVHLYEGWKEHEVTRAVRAFVGLGCRAVLLTNAAGGLRRGWRPGTLMRVCDHLNLQGRTPLGREEAGGGRVYDEALGTALERGASEARVALESGVYAGLLGPSYETPAEIRMLGWMGVDAVGMSTVGEALAARAAGARVAAVSCITNLAAGITGERLSHAEVVEAGREAAGRFAGVLEHSIPHFAKVVGRG